MGRTEKEEQRWRKKHYENKLVRRQCSYSGATLVKSVKVRDQFKPVAKSALGNIPLSRKIPNRVKIPVEMPSCSPVKM